MSLDDLNRDQKRSLKRMGALNEQGNPTRVQPTAARRPKESRVTPAKYLSEVRDEMRKVAWPKWPEVRRFSIIVLATVVVYMAYVFGLDSLFGVLSGWLYD
jgi:preprotein translocase subunit SecE